MNQRLKVVPCPNNVLIGGHHDDSAEVAEVTGTLRILLWAGSP